MTPNDPAPPDLLAAILGLVGRAFLAPILETIMPTLQEITVQVQQTRQDVQAAVDRSKQFADLMAAKIADLKAQIEAGQNAPPELVAAIDEIDALSKSIDPTLPDVVPTPTPTPTPTPEPTPTPTPTPEPTPTPTP